ncbi:thioester reductase domain-containing protein [Streptomyces sp. NPDC004539]|uniref:thioester reductase domain-containing protein n=1 Tax=Streptomyces sp. NPDC004539 TaxID=3154280 RepID=UPI0033B894A5
MRDEDTMNEAAAGPGADRAHEAHSIEGARPARDSVDGLLSRVRRKAPEPARRTGAPAEPWDVDRLASAIAATAGELLGGTPLDADTDLFDAGASSVTAVELVARLARDLDVRIELDSVFADARPRRLAGLWLAGQPGGHEPPAPVTRSAPRETAPAAALPADEDLRLVLGDLARADTLPFVDAPPLRAPRRVLLTGATGFLGGHLLLDLLRHSDAHVVCLVRAADEERAEQRLADALRSFHLPWSAELRRRVTALPGDLGQPRLGLTGGQWRTLAEETDAVVSVGAAVDFLRGYPSLRRANVHGPLTLAELAVTGPVKPLHHISSVAVFNEVGITAMGEDDPLARVDRLVAGYDKSKWAAETALRRAREHGLTVTLLRPGGIAGHTETGAHNPHDLSTGFSAAFSRFRTVPAFRALNVAPVDWVSRVAAAVVCDPDAWGQTYNLTGRAGTLDGTVREMRLAGMNVDVLGWDDWRADFRARMEADPVPELDFLVRVLDSPTALKLCEASLFGPAATADRTDAFVARRGLPPAAVYDAPAQLRTVERMAERGLSRLPDRTDPPYLWFSETMRGTLGPAGEPADSDAEFKLTLSVASMYQLLRERRIDVRDGTVTCARLHAEPLTVVDGDVVVRPQDGVPYGTGIRHPLLGYRLRLRDTDGGEWWLDGRKTARARRDLLRQARTLAVEIGRQGGPASASGVMVVPADSYVREQIDGIRVRPGLSSRERRLAKATWLAWFGAQLGQGLAEPLLRAGAELLDLRRDRPERLEEPTR